VERFRPKTPEDVFAVSILGTLALATLIAFSNHSLQVQSIVVYLGAAAFANIGRFPMSMGYLRSTEKRSWLIFAGACLVGGGWALLNLFFSPWTLGSALPACGELLLLAFIGLVSTSPGAPL
jgi:hypothetical protein